MHLDLSKLEFIIMPEILAFGESLYQSLEKRKLERSGEGHTDRLPKEQARKRPRNTRLRETDPW